MKFKVNKYQTSALNPKRIQLLSEFFCLWFPFVHIIWHKFTISFFIGRCFPWKRKAIARRCWVLVLVSVSYFAESFSNIDFGIRNYCALEICQGSFIFSIVHLFIRFLRLNWTFGNSSNQSYSNICRFGYLLNNLKKTLWFMWLQILKHHN